MKESSPRARIAERITEYRKHLEADLARYQRLPDGTPGVIEEVHERLRQAKAGELAYFNRAFKLEEPPQQEQFSYAEIKSGLGMDRDEFDRIARERGITPVGDDEDRYSRSDVVSVAADFYVSWGGRQHPADQEFLPFDDTLALLDMTSNELKRLVSEGEIRAFRDGQSMKFRPEDVYSVRDGILEGQ